MIPTESPSELPTCQKQYPNINPKIYTIGHSTRSIDAFIELLQAYGVQLLVDIRTIPKSRNNPQYNAAALKTALQDAGIDFLPMPSLGGFRRPSPNSINTGWRNKSFQGYADYMQTNEFRESLNHLIDLANNRTIVMMCAEAVPWRCHRSLIADALLVYGFEVEDIMGTKSHPKHKLTPWAKVEKDRISYPSTASDLNASEKL